MIAGRYSLDREIGRGGMGTVWLGRDEVLGRSVALKRIGMVPGAGSPDLARAEREARLAARLSHPNVVAVFDLVVENDQQWLVMEYVEHRTLAALVQDQGPLPSGQAGPLLGQAAAALAAAHAAGIVHRDVKPSNILVTRRGLVKLTDFGIARAAADATLTQTGLVTGSPAYLAPEVASGQAATTASDVWSLGATLYHALAGRPPYEVGENLMGTLYRIVHDEPPRLPGAGWLAPLLACTMTRDPADRWPMDRVRDVLTAGPDTAVAMVGPHVAPPPVASREPDPAPDDGPARPPRKRRGSLLPLLMGAGIVLVAGLLAWVLLTSDEAPDRGTAASPRQGRSSSSDPRARGDSPSTEPGTEPGTHSSTEGGPTRQGMQEFIGDYLATVTSDPRQAFGMLTPRFQRASGGLEGYEGFWDTIRSARLRSFTDTDPGTLTIGYRVDYTRRDGSRASDQTSLQLVYQDGRYLVAGES